MKAHIVRVGTSRGLRLPKPLPEQTGPSGAVDLEADGDCLILWSPNRASAGLGEANRAMRGSAESALLDGDAAAATAGDEAAREWQRAASTSS